MLLRVSLTRKTSEIPALQMSLHLLLSGVTLPRYALWVAIFRLLVLNSIASSEVRDNHLETATRLGIRRKLVTLKSSSLGYDL